MRVKLKYFIPIIAFFAFFGLISTVSAVYICESDGSKWPERGDCDLYCKKPPCVEEGVGDTHKECKNGACMVVQGSGVDLCQSESACRQKVCEGQSCVLKLAPGPGGLGPDQCQTNANCAYSPPPSGPRDPKEGEPTPVPRDSTTQPRQRDSGQGVSIPNPIGPGTFQDLVERIARYLFQIGIPIAVIMILYAAFLYMTAGGSEEKVSKAHKALTYAVVGLAVLFLAWGITSLVKELLGGQ